MSVCLQSLVDELLMKKNGIRKKPCPVTKRGWSYMRRDGSSQLISVDELEGENKVSFMYYMQINCKLVIKIYFYFMKIYPL